MNEVEKHFLYKKAWEKWGDLQYWMVIEETAELQKTLTKHMRGKGNAEHICEEIADVEIMLEQLKERFGCVDEVKERKLERLKQMVEGD